MKLIATLLVCSFIFGIFPPLLAVEGDIGLTIEGEVLSARLKEIPLKIILARLERETGIWFRGDSSLLEEEVTIQFTRLPLEEGLKRILSSMNYVLLFDRNGGLVGVVVIGKGKAGLAVSEGSSGTKEKTISPSSIGERADIDDSFTVIRNLPPPGGYGEVTEEEREGSTVIRNCPPPGGPFEVTAEERERFTVIRNCPPPGGSFEVSAEEREGFTVIRNCPPPGGPFEVTAEEREGFTVIRNCPPPGS